MKKWAGGALLLGLAAIWAAFLGDLFWLDRLRRSGLSPDFVRHPYATAKSCGQCHSAQFTQWAGSPHARALGSLGPRQLNPGEKVENCLPCHAPEPVLQAGLEHPPLARAQERGDGVSCQSCHQLEKGVAAGPNPPPGACQPHADGRLTSVELCQACHNAHGTVDQWRQWSKSQPGRDCLSCHGGHEMAGAHDHNAVRGALDLQLACLTDRVEVTVINRGAGHNIPSGRRSRELFLLVDFHSLDGTSGRYRERLRNPFKGEPGSNTQLGPAERRIYRYTKPARPGWVEARLFYRFRPSPEDEEGVLLLSRLRSFSAGR
ncbi:MAG: multiheme c-type cytochrome [Vulcanimicrobiota bacterium]